MNALGYLLFAVQIATWGAGVSWWGNRLLEQRRRWAFAFMLFGATATEAFVIVLALYGAWFLGETL